MKALYRRAVTGEGARIDLSMLRSAVSWMASPLLLAASLGERITRKGNSHQFFAPVSVFTTRDGYVYVAVGNDLQWAALEKLPGFQTLASPAYATNAGRVADAGHLERELGERFVGLATEEALALLQGAGVPVARVNTLADVVADPLVAPRLQRVTDPRTGLAVVLPAPPASDPPPLSFPPRLGEHNERIYGEALGYPPERLADLRRRRVL
jgi:crotonobetainyl-CoA:carnitine CoA-transferase CaiB-like acyl-CoA transferase